MVSWVVKIVRSASSKTALSGAHVYDSRHDESAIFERDTYP